MANYKKWAFQQQEELVQQAVGGVIRDILSILDNIERAFQTLPHGLLRLTWLEGLLLIQQKFYTILRNHGLTEVEAEGKSFDPGQHEAVMNGAGEEGKILEVFQRGYKLKDRLLRPALVKVARAKGDRETDSSDQGETKG